MQRRHYSIESLDDNRSPFMRSFLLIGALISHLALTHAAPLQPVSGLTQWQNDILDNILTRYGITDVKQLASLDPNALQSVNAGTPSCPFFHFAR